MKVSGFVIAVRTFFVIGLLCIGLLLANATIRNNRANSAETLRMVPSSQLCC